MITNRELKTFCVSGIGTDSIHFGEFMRRIRSWKRGSGRRPSILRSALKNYGRSAIFPYMPFQGIGELCLCLPIPRRPLQSYKAKHNWFAIGAPIRGGFSAPLPFWLWLLRVSQGSGRSESPCDTRQPSDIQEWLPAFGLNLHIRPRASNARTIHLNYGPRTLGLSQSVLCNSEGDS